jgi:hypothetical protein
MMILVWHYCSPNSAPKRCKQPRAQVKYQGVLNSTSCSRSPECSAGWVSVFTCKTRTRLTGFRLGCHALALDLVRSWSFERPSISVLAPSEPPPSPYTALRRSLALDPKLRRRSTIMIDMDVGSAPPTRRVSPDRSLAKLPTQEPINEESDLLARKAGLGSLLKFARQDVQVPEFNMDSFNSFV